MNDAPAIVLGDAQRALRDRFDDFRRAFDRRDQEAYRVALSDFHDHLRRWTITLEEILVPALGSAARPRHDLSRELKLDFVQLRELTRHILEQIAARAPLADVLGLVENLDRRLIAHGSQIETVYGPAAGEVLGEEGRQALRAACPDP